MKNNKKKTSEPVSGAAGTSGASQPQGTPQGATGTGDGAGIPSTSNKGRNGWLTFVLNCKNYVFYLSCISNDE